MLVVDILVVLEDMVAVVVGQEMLYVSEADLDEDGRSEIKIIDLVQIYP